MVFLFGSLILGCTLVGFFLGHMAARRQKPWQTLLLWGVLLATLYTYTVVVDVLAKMLTMKQ